jgi:RHS repeat-associated protein
MRKSRSSERRIQKSGPLGTTNYLYDGSQSIEEVDNAGDVLVRYANGESLDEPLSMQRSAITSYYHPDGLGNITSLSNTTGGVAQSYSFDAFGRTTSTTGLANPFQYTARESDTETGLYYYRSRYYDPNVGRFLGEDSALFGGGVNFYSYVQNSPTGLVDPTGNYARLNPMSRCAKVFAEALQSGLCPGAFAEAFNKAASSVPIYTIHSASSPAANYTQNQVSGNHNNDTLGSMFFSYFNPPDASTITDGSQPAIVLGPGYFTYSKDMRVAMLIHEEFHAVTGLGDADIFALFVKYGLSDKSFKLWPHPTSEFSEWIAKGCPK